MSTVPSLPSDTAIDRARKYRADFLWPNARVYVLKWRQAGYELVWTPDWGWVWERRSPFLYTFAVADGGKLTRAAIEAGRIRPIYPLRYEVLDVEVREVT